MDEKCSFWINHVFVSFRSCSRLYCGNEWQTPHNHGTYTFGGAGGTDGAYMGGINAVSYVMNVPATATNQYSGGNETRPINANVIFCVAY